MPLNAVGLFALPCSEKSVCLLCVGGFAFLPWNPPGFVTAEKSPLHCPLWPTCSFCDHPGAWPSPSAGIDERSGEKFKQGFTGTRAAVEGGRTSNRCPALSLRRRASWFLKWVRAVAGPGVRPERCPGWSAHLLRGIVCRGCEPDPAFAPDTLEVAVGFLVFFYLLSAICPNCTCTQLLLVPLVSWYL